jgi:hypothetical protein
MMKMTMKKAPNTTYHGTKMNKRDAMILWGEDEQES